MLYMSRYYFDYECDTHALHRDANECVQNINTFICIAVDRTHETRVHPEAMPVYHFNHISVAVVEQL